MVELVGASASGVRFAGAVIKSTPSIIFDFVVGQSASLAKVSLMNSVYQPNRASAIAGTLDLVRTTLLTPGRGHRGVMKQHRDRDVDRRQYCGRRCVVSVHRSRPSRVLACGL